MGFVNDDGLDDNVGVTTVFVQNPGTGYSLTDTIDETGFIVDTGLPDVDDQTVPEPVQTDPTTGQPVPSNVPDPYTDLVSPGDRVTVANIKDKPTYELVIDPTTGGINAVKVLNTLRFTAPPVLTVVSSTGEGAILRPIFGPIPEDQQQGVITVVDCVRGS